MSKLEDLAPDVLGIEAIGKVTSGLSSPSARSAPTATPSSCGRLPRGRGIAKEAQRASRAETRRRQVAVSTAKLAQDRALLIPCD